MASYGRKGEDCTLRVGYAVRMPEDTPTTFNEEVIKQGKNIARKISLGRAETPDSCLNDTSEKIAKEYSSNFRMLKEIAKHWEFRLQEDNTLIKGIGTLIK